MPLDLIKPEVLARGDKIAALSISWGGPFVFPNKYALGKKRLKDIFGLETIEMDYTVAHPDFLKDNPEKRAQDLMKAFLDPSIKGIIATIGGNDAIKILPYINYEIIRKNPKVVIGFSDTTVLHFICMKAGISSFYGTSIMCELSENVQVPNYTFSSFEKTLFNSTPLNLIQSSDFISDEYLDWSQPTNASKQRIWEKADEWQYIQGTGQHEGYLLGGCLETLDMLLDTELWPNIAQWKDAILFIEISEEKPTPAMVEKMLQKFAEKKIFNVLKGILFGYPSGQLSKTEVLLYDHSILNVCKTVNRTDLPIITRMNFGHTIPTFVIPYGAKAIIDCNNKTFSILEKHCLDRNLTKSDVKIKHTLSTLSHFQLNRLLERRAILAHPNKNASSIHRLFQHTDEHNVKENLISLLQAINAAKQDKDGINDEKQAYTKIKVLLETLKIDVKLLEKHNHLIEIINSAAQRSIRDSSIILTISKTLNLNNPSRFNYN